MYRLLSHTNFSNLAMFYIGRLQDMSGTLTGRGNALHGSILRSQSFSGFRGERVSGAFVSIFEILLELFVKSTLYFVTPTPMCSLATIILSKSYKVHVSTKQGTKALSVYKLSER